MKGWEGSFWLDRSVSWLGFAATLVNQRSRGEVGLNPLWMISLLMWAGSGALRGTSGYNAEYCTTSNVYTYERAHTHTHTHTHTHKHWGGWGEEGVLINNSNWSCSLCAEPLFWFSACCPPNKAFIHAPRLTHPHADNSESSASTRSVRMHGGVQSCSTVASVWWAWL